MLPPWTLRVALTTADFFIANNVNKQRVISSINRPSAFHKSHESTSNRADSKAVKEPSHYTSVHQSRPSDSENDCNENDALHLLAKVEPTLSLTKENIQVRKLVVDDTKAGISVKIRRVNDRPTLRYIRAPARIEAQDALKTDVQDRKSSAKVAEVAPRGLSSLYKFDPERELLCATATRRPLQLRLREGIVIEPDQHIEDPSFAESQTPEHTDLSGRPQRTSVVPAERRKVLSRALKRRRVRQRLSGQFWRFVSKRSVVTGPVRLVKMRRQLRVRDKRPDAKPQETHTDVRLRPKHRVTKRRLRSNSMYLLRLTARTPHSGTNAAESLESLTLNPSASAIANPESSKASYDDSDLADAIDDLTSAPQWRPATAQTGR